MTFTKSILLTAAVLGLAITPSQATIIFSEDFESFVEGATTTAAADSFVIINGFNVRTDFWAVEGPGTDPAGTGNNGSDLFDVTNTRGFGLRDLDGDDNPGGPNRLDFDPIDTTGFTGLTFTFSFDLASGASTYNDNGDTIRVEFDLNYDGVTFDADETYDLTGTANLGDGIVTSTASAFTNFTYELTGAVTGDLGLRISALGMQDGNDRVTFDNIEVSAVPEPSTFALLAGIGALGFILYRRRR